MANVKPNVNGYLSDVDRVAIVKKRLLASDDFSPKDRREGIACCDKLTAMYTKRIVELGVTEDVISARLPRRKSKNGNGNGHAIKSA